MTRESARVQAYFERMPLAFDRIYQHDRGRLLGLLERWRHRSMFERFRLTLEACGDVRGKRILDIGCGSGRYAVELARRGAEVVGVDFSAPMVGLASRTAGGAGVAVRCRFLVGDILSLPLQEPFDISLAIGVFDYTSQPGPILEKMRRLSRLRFLASFPVRHHALTWLRKLRLFLAGCPVYFYTESDVRALLREHAAHVTLHALGRDYLVIGERADASQRVTQGHV